MIKVTMFCNNETYTGFKVTGHAMQGPYGEDLVCAAVSAIVQTAMLGITDVLHIKPKKVVRKEGNSCFILDQNVSESDLKDVNIILQTMLKGLESIQLSYKGTLEIRSKEVEHHV